MRRRPDRLFTRRGKSIPREAGRAEARAKARYAEHLHEIRRQEFDIIFGGLPAKAFPVALELGAGDLFQSRLLARYAGRLVSTDYREPTPESEPPTNVVYAECDAERVAEVFRNAQFDLVFSSNVLEHVRRPRVALEGIRSILAPTGLTVHLMPNRLFKISHVFLHVPNLVRRGFPMIVADRNPRAAFASFKAASGQSGDEAPWYTPAVRRKRVPLAMRLLIPPPHGASDTNRREFAVFSRKRWESEFAAAGFDVIAVLRGPLASGYGFGLNRLRSILNRAGFCSEFVYVARPVGHITPFDEHFASHARVRH